MAITDGYGLQTPDTATSAGYTFNDPVPEPLIESLERMSTNEILDAIMESQARLEDKLDGLIEVLAEFMPLLEQVRAKMSKRRFGGN